MSRLPIRSAALAAPAARLSYAGLRRRPPGGDRTWSRTNHRGEPVTLLEGPAAAAGGIAGALAAPGLAGRERAALVLAGAAAAALGSYDDLAGSGKSRGFRGHLGALARVAALAAVVGLTAASEVVSFTRVIARTPPLNWVDMLGRRSPAAASPPGAAAGPAVAAGGDAGAAGTPAAAAPR
jgi:UDP-GlcNAc:undecaprenyl-phosphate GlcNAc-1-phosphate transferase